MDKISMYYPYAYADSVFQIDYEKLHDKGIRGLIFDIDNTLVHHGEDSTPEIDALFLRLRNLGFETLLLTNNDEERVQRFIKNIDTSYICDADKPAPGKYLEAVEQMNLKKNQVVCVGDQVFTDILGANRSGIAGILVHFIRQPGEKWLGVKRYLEMVILWCWRHSRNYYNRLGTITYEGK